MKRFMGMLSIILILAFGSAACGPPQCWVDVDSQDYYVEAEYVAPYWVDTSYYVDLGYWVDSGYYDYDGYWVDTSYYVDLGYWVDDGYWAGDYWEPGYWVQGGYYADCPS